MGAGLVVLKSDWSKAGLCMDSRPKTGTKFIYFTELNALKSAQ